METAIIPNRHKMNVIFFSQIFLRYKLLKFIQFYHFVYAIVLCFCIFLLCQHTSSFFLPSMFPCHVKYLIVHSLFMYVLHHYIVGRWQGKCLYSPVRVFMFAQPCTKYIFLEYYAHNRGKKVSRFVNQTN